MTQKIGAIVSDNLSSQTRAKSHTYVKISRASLTPKTQLTVKFACTFYFKQEHNLKVKGLVFVDKLQGRNIFISHFLPRSNIDRLKSVAGIS